MIKFPYGIADFKKIITRDFYYSDRTSAIPALEQAESQLFIRPRRFGKSLLLSMLENYYDIAQKDEFGTLFGHLAIGKNPTPYRNSYFILRLDFSCIDPSGTPDEIKKSLYNHVNSRINTFLLAYQDNFPDLSKISINPQDALSSLDSLAGAAKKTEIPIYLLIDEYDNFANTVMMQPFDNSADRYKALVHEEGPLKTVFKTIKASTGGAMFDRVFITGVSPVVMSDITSGYNIAKDIFLAPVFADLCGFREEEVRQTLLAIAAGCGFNQDKADDALSMMRSYYNGYNFNPRLAKPENVNKSLVYNPTMCLYFFDEFQQYCEFPRRMLDANMATDEGKLRYISQIEGGAEIIDRLVKRNESLTISDIEDRFGLNAMLSDSSKDKKFLASFLYFFGVLTLAGQTDELNLRLRVPNLVMRKLYVDTMILLYLPKPVIRDKGRLAAELVYQKGDIAPLCAFVEQHLLQVLSNRDYAQASELTIKTAFLALLYNDIIYIMDSEPEVRRAYADLTMIIRPDMRHGKIFDVLIEFKFLSLKDLRLTGREIKALPEKELSERPGVKKILEEGKKQANEYGKSLEDKYKKLRLKKFVVVSLGFDRIIFLNANDLEHAVL